MLEDLYHINYARMYSSLGKAQERSAEERISYKRKRFSSRRRISTARTGIIRIMLTFALELRQDRAAIIPLRFATQAYLNGAIEMRSRWHCHGDYVSEASIETNRCDSFVLATMKRHFT